MEFGECGHLEIRHEKPEFHGPENKFCNACHGYCLVDNMDKSGRA